MFQGKDVNTTPVVCLFPLCTSLTFCPDTIVTVNVLKYSKMWFTAEVQSLNTVCGEFGNAIESFSKWDILPSTEHSIIEGPVFDTILLSTALHTSAFNL